MADEAPAPKKQPVPPRFEKAPAEVYAMAQSILTAHYPELIKAAVTFDFIFCHAPRDGDNNPTRPAVMRHGTAAAGLARIVPLKDRAMGRSDGEIHLDADQWPSWSDNQRRALVDHEINHFMVRYDKTMNMRRDDVGRPMLEMRPHDFEFGWFTIIAERYGADSGEVQQAVSMYKRASAILFPQNLLAT